LVDKPNTMCYSYLDKAAHQCSNPIALSGILYVAR
jgi:hypothetical protein